MAAIPRLLGAILLAAAHWSSSGPPGAPGVLLIDSSDSSRAFAGTSTGLYRSFDGGESWQISTLRESITALAQSTTSPATLYALTDGGLERTSDFGASWTLAGIPPSFGVVSLVVDPLEPDTVCISGQIFSPFNDGVLVSRDGGARWEDSGLGGGKAPAPYLAATSGAVYAIPPFGTFRRTADGGRTWTNVPFPIRGSSPGPGAIAGAVVDSVTDALVVVMDGKIWSTLDGGGTWVSGGDVPSARVTGLAARASVLFDATDHGIYRSADMGSSWSLVVPEPATSIAVSKSDPFLALGGAGSGVWRSTDAFGSFDLSSTSLPGSQHFRLALEQGHTVFAIPDRAEGGLIFRRTESGAWEEFSREPPGSAFAIDPRDPSIQYFSPFYSAGSCPALQKTTDAGQTWMPVGAPLCGVERISIDPDNSRRLIITALDGLSLSTDGGLTRKRTSTQYGYPVLFDAERPGRVYAGNLSSADGGATWTAGPVPDPLCDSTGSFCQPQSLAIDERTGAVYAVTARDYRLYRRADFGGAWTALPATGLSDIRDIAIDPSTGDIVAGTRTGVFRSRDGGLNFEAVDPGGLSADVSSVIVRGSDGALFAAARGVIWELGATILRDTPVGSSHRPPPRVVPPRPSAAPRSRVSGGPGS